MVSEMVRERAMVAWLRPQGWSRNPTSAPGAAFRATKRLTRADCLLWGDVTAGSALRVAEE